MVPAKGGFILVISGISVRQYSLFQSSVDTMVTSPQRVNALFHSWQLVCISYGHRVNFSVAGTETKLSVFFRGKHHRAFPFLHCGLDQVLIEHLFNLLSSMLSCLQLGLIRMLE